MQVRMGHLPLNSYLHRISKSDTDECMACIEMESQPRRETVEQFLFECKAYDRQRADLSQLVGSRNMYIGALMGSTSKMWALTNFIRKTERMG